jgi:putative FmdB family regulatory protein
MPIYEYLCGACGHELEAFQKMTDGPLIECPACHKPKLNKLVSAAGFQLKGTGWYVTDFKNKGKPEVKSSGSQSDETQKSALAGEETKTQAHSETQTGVKTDIKTETKTDTKTGTKKTDTKTDQ